MKLCLQVCNHFVFLVKQLFQFGLAVIRRWYCVWRLRFFGLLKKLTESHDLIAICVDFTLKLLDFFVLAFLRGSWIRLSCLLLKFSFKLFDLLFELVEKKAFLLVLLRCSRYRLKVVVGSPRNELHELVLLRYFFDSSLFPHDLHIMHLDERPQLTVFISQIVVLLLESHCFFKQRITFSLGNYRGNRVFSPRN